MILKGSQCRGETNAKRENSHFSGQFVLRSVSVVSSQAAVTAVWQRFTRGVTDIY